MSAELPPMPRDQDADAARDELRGWLRAAAQGDRDAFQALYERTSAKLFGVCLRILGDRNEAEDVLQEVYLSVWRKADRFDGDRASPVTWLASIARNRAIDRLRASGLARASQPIDLTLAETLADDRADVRAAAEARSDGERLHACLDELAPDQRNVIRTAFFEGATYEEIAARSRTPLGTVKSWIRRGLLRLKACLQR